MWSHVTHVPTPQDTLQLYISSGVPLSSRDTLSNLLHWPHKNLMANNHGDPEGMWALYLLYVTKELEI